MKKIYIILSVIFLGFLFIGTLFFILYLSEKDKKADVEEKEEKYSLKIDSQDILYEYNDYVYVLTETSDFHNNEIYYVGLFAKNKKDYIPFSSEQEFTLLKEFEFCEFFHMKNYKKAVFIDGKFYYVTDEKNVIEVYTLNGLNVLKEVITLEEGNVGSLGDFGIESIDDNYIYLMSNYEYSSEKWNKVRCSKTTYICELFE